MSLEFAKREFKNVESYCNFDMALNLNYKFNFERMVYCVALEILTMKVE